jgi:hypothetical protein
MTLRDVLQLPIFVGLTDQQAKARGDQASDPILISTLQTVAALADVLDDADSRLVLATIRQAGAIDPLVDAFYLKFCSRGVDFSNAKLQAQIDQLGTAGNWGDVLTARVKAFGVVAQSMWQTLGLVASPSLADITAARATIAADAERARVVAAWNATINALDAGAITTYAAAVTLFGSH